MAHAALSIRSGSGPQTMPAFGIGHQAAFLAQSARMSDSSSFTETNADCRRRRRLPASTLSTGGPRIWVLPSRYFCFMLRAWRLGR